MRRAICTLLLLCGTWSPIFADTKPLTAIFLVARSELPDPSFADSMVLVMNNLAPEPIGIIINRPTRIPVSQLFPHLKQLTKTLDKVYFGGPVELDTVWFLVRSPKVPPHAVKACEGVYLSGDRDLLMKLLARDKPMEGLRLFIGHSGWGPGQLESEISNGDWTLKNANADSIFDRKSEHPWPESEDPKDST